jgi:hypothetical protein
MNGDLIERTNVRAGHSTDMALPTAVEITPIAAATEPKGPRMLFKVFMNVGQ